METSIEVMQQTNKKKEQEAHCYPNKETHYRSLILESTLTRILSQVLSCSDLCQKLQDSFFCG